jgi:glycosyltransferase involved in cell wall biosynthesis
LRIGVNTLFYIPNEVGGTETYLRQTLQPMVEMYPNSVFILFTNRENNPVLQADLSQFSNVEYRMLNFRASNRFARIIREQTELPFRLNCENIDVLWSPGYTTPIFFTRPQVTTIHDMQYKRHPEDLSYLARIVTDVLVKSAARISRRVITCSRFSKEEIIRFTAARPNRVHAISEAVTGDFGQAPIPLYQHSANVLRSLSTKPYLLTVANTYPHKNIHTLIEAFGLVMSNIEHDLIIVGLPRRGETQVQEALSGLEDRIRIKRVSRLSTDEIISLYSFADVFVFPSLYEGFGLPVLEAMLAGVPVVTTRMGSIPETGGDFVVYADPPGKHSLAQKILEVLDWDPQQRENRVQKAKKRAETFSWKSTAVETFKVLKKAALNSA